MKSRTVLAVALLVALVPPLAASPAPAPVPQLSPAVCSGAADLLFDQAFLAAGSRTSLTEATCSATADCGQFSDVSCTTSVSGATCQGVDRDCGIGERGYVRCGSSYSYCPPCGAVCEDGDVDLVSTSFCCTAEPVSEQLHRLYRCVNGQWQFSHNLCIGRCFQQPEGGS